MFNIFKKEENHAEPKAYIFIGRSGCGKGTQVELFKKVLEEKTGVKTLHIETGAFFREFMKGDGYTQELTRQVLNTGSIMPESFAIGLWVNYLMNNFTGKENIIFDGAPRKLQEAVLLDGTLNFYNIKNYKIIDVKVSREWATKRLFARGRKDDTEDGINNRMNWFENYVMPCVDFFKNSKDCEVFDINGEQTIEEVHAEVMKKVFNE
ncbi:MAG: nucleoside monophosphate kinase [Candidatus Paceibacterota bacterium]|jgi:adenylate kinase family enzyme